MLKILIADDENIEIQFLNSIFADSKYKDRFRVVASAMTGKSAVEKAEKFNPDIVIMDIKMPIMSGIDSAAEIKRKNPETIIILNTAYAEFEFAKKALENHFEAYLLKPSSKEEIIGTIESCVEKSKIYFTGKIGHEEGNATDMAKAYIKNNLENKMSLQEIAAVAHFAPSHFSKLFREKEGITVSKYINNQRAEKAGDMLCNSSDNISEISKLCGFCNISNFNRVFKEYFGMTPMEFRRDSDKNG